MSESPTPDHPSRPGALPRERTVSPRREVCFVIGRGGAILWSDASNDPSALPDSRQRWQAIWSHRDEIEEIAHSHPNGPAAFSSEDESTMSALVSGLGRSMRFSVVAPRAMVAREVRDEPTDLLGDLIVEPEPWWAGLLRLASGMHDESA